MDSSGGPVRIVIDALAARLGGTAYAVVQMASQLARRPEVHSVAVIAREGSIVERGLRGSAQVRLLSMPAVERVELPRRLLWEARRLPALARAERADVVITMSGMLPAALGCRVLCMQFN